MANENLSPDIYGVNEYVNNIKKEFITGVNEDTLMLGIFGYFGQISSDLLQNSIVMASEFSNESIATKAKFEKNIIAHALGLGITDINAVPAQMEVLLTFIEDDIINWANAKTADGTELPWTFVFDKDNKIYFGEYEFHPDYDIVIKKVEVTTQGTKKRFAYTAQYKQDDFDTGNPVSDITNPYLTPPVKIRSNGMNIIFTKCIIRQVEKAVQSTRILADNDVSAKTITFTFDGQLAAFSLDVTEGTETYHMIPVYEGLNVDTGGKLYFWYTYLDTNTIRIKFDRNSRIPSVNANVQINLQTTAGSAGNFTFYGENYPNFSFESERLNYSNIMCEVRPVDGSAVYGSDKKSIADLKKIIPKEALSRGSITNLTDLENYFNMLNTEYSKLYFYKKRDNCLERLYYSFMLMRNDLNIVPTNTVNLVISPSDLQTEEGSGKLILKQGQVIVLTPGEEEAKLLGPDEVLPDEDGSLYDGRFAYYLPYDFIVNQSPLYGMYFLTIMHANKILDFSYINDSCLYQYISTKISWDRNCLEDHNVYTLGIDVEQNIVPEDGDNSDSPIYEDDEGNIVCNVDVYMIIYNKENTPLRWSKATMLSVDKETGIISYQFKFTTEDYIDNENRIRIDTGLYDIGSNNESYAHLNANMTTKIFIVSKQGANYGLGDPALSKYIPGLEDGWSLSNTYDVIGGLDFFYDYSGIVSSIITVTEDEIVSDENTDEGNQPSTDDPFEDGETDDPFGDETIVFDDLGVILAYMSDSELQLYDTDRNKIGPVINLPMGDVVVDFDQDVEAGTIKLYFDAEKTKFITVNTRELTYEEPEPIPTETHYHIVGVPVVKYDYFADEETAKTFYDELVSRKAYIDQAVDVLEDAFEMDFKFFNTYGPSKFFTWDNGTAVIDRVNISLFFRLKLKPNFDSNIVEDIRKDIKDYIEDINSINSLHIPNLITYITNRYSDSIVFFEFVSINGKEASYQHIYAMDIPDGIIVPEFVNINTLPDSLPDITIELV